MNTDEASEYSQLEVKKQEKPTKITAQNNFLYTHKTV